MRFPVLIALLVLPFLAVAQNQNTPTTQSTQSTSTSASTASTNSTSVSLILSTSLTTGVQLVSGRIPQSFTSTIVVTITPTPTPSQSSGNSSSSSSSSPSSTGPLPTAPTNVDGGGNGPNGAPVPGQSAPGGIYGPPDGYVSPALPIAVNTILALVAGMALGGVLVLA